MDYSEQIILQEEDNINIREILTKYLHHWYWFVIGVVLLLTGAFIYLKMTTPVYEVNSSLLIREDNSAGGHSLENDIMSQFNMFGANANVDNEMAIIQSHSLAKQVVKELNICTLYYIQDGFRLRELYRSSPIEVGTIHLNDTLSPVELNIEWQADHKYTVSDGDGRQTITAGEVANLPSGRFMLRPSAAVKDTFRQGMEMEVHISPLSFVVQSYQQNLQVNTSSQSSTVLNLNLKTTTPQKGIDFLNTLIEAYNQAGLKDKNQTAANTVHFVDSRLDSISGELNGVETQLEQFMQSHSMANIDEQSKLFLDQVKDVDNNLAIQQLRLKMLQSIGQYISQPGNHSGLVPSSLGIEDPTLLSLIQQYNQLKTERSRNLQAGATENNPLITTLDSQVVRLNESIRENVRNLQAGTQLAVNKLEQKSQYFENQIRSVPALQRNYITIKRQQEIKQNLYLYLLQKREEAAIQQAASIYGSRLVDPATVVPKPVSPKKSLIYLAAFILGLGIPAALLYAGDLLNNKIHSRKEVESHTATPILGEIAHSSDGDQIVVKPGSRIAIAEQFRSLRTNLAFVTGNVPGAQKLLITSSSSGEGKSFISLNLAASYALADKRTVVLGLDLRNPKLTRVLQKEHMTGISNYLAGQASLEELPIELPFGNHQLYFISSGPIPPNPSELLLRPQMEELMNYLEKQFDVIILDTPPVGMVTDAQILSRYSDISLFIVRHNYTLKGQVQIIEQLYKQKKFSNLSVILNDIKQGDAYRYQYGYGYGYGYYDDEPRSWKRQKRS